MAPTGYAWQEAFAWHFGARQTHREAGRQKGRQKAGRQKAGKRQVAGWQDVIIDVACNWPPGMSFHERPCMRTIFVQPIAHVESPESKRRIHSLLHVSGLLKETVLIDSLSATTEDVLRVHSKEYLGE
eukprot:759109-Hanusia_phi.AAC.1